MKEQRSSCPRTRNYACVIYPDSVPDNWHEIIDSWHVPVFVSPLHDQDFNPTGEHKEAHWHVMLMFDNVKTEAQARELFAQINGKGCEVIKSIRSYARYLCHLDNPEKSRYPVDKVLSFSGADYLECISSLADKVDGIKAIQHIVDLNDVISYWDLCLILENDFPELFRLLVLSTTLHIKEYIKSRFWRLHVYGTDKE